TTLADYAAAHPLARIVNTASGGGVRIGAGCRSPLWAGFVGDVDLFTIGVNGVETTYDFEPSAPTDTTSPTITLVSRTPANANGWNNGPVTVTWSCADSGSGPVAPRVSRTVGAEGANQSATGTCADLAGNTASATATGI